MTAHVIEYPKNVIQSRVDGEQQDLSNGTWAIRIGQAVHKSLSFVGEQIYENNSRFLCVRCWRALALNFVRLVFRF